MIGQMLANRYHIIEKVGEGGMALVYKAKDTLLGRPVAVKVLRPQFASDSDFVLRFRREAQTAASLSHPNVVNIYDVGEFGETHYIIMEYIEGRNLKEILREQGVFSPARAREIGKEVARALHHAHRHGLVHRDIKPHNILITDEGRVKVTDFGIARAASTSTLTHTGMVLGSVHYFSPEQARGDQVGLQSDIYSLGVLLYEMVTGQVPFSGESPIAIALKHLQEPVTPPSEINPDVPAELEHVIMRALTKEPAERYGSALEVLEDLRKVPGTVPDAELKDDPQEATRILPVPDGTQVYDRTMLRSAHDEGGTGTAAERRRSPWVWWMVALGLLVGLVFAAGRLENLIFPPDIVVPNIVGRTVPEARELLESKGLRFASDKRVYHETVPAGRIISQDPRPDQPAKEGRTIFGVVSLGPEFVQVPDVVGLSLREAKLAITQEALVLGTVQDAFDPNVPTGFVISQSPEGNTRLTKRASVDLVVSKGTEPVTTLPLPDFRGLPLADVRTRLAELGLQLGNTVPDFSATVPADHVIDQNPPPETQVETNFAIDFVISQGPPGGVGLFPGDSDSDRSRDKINGSGGSSAPTESSGKWHTADVTVTVPPGPDQEVVILVVDDFGVREIFRETRPAGDTFTKRVQGRGDDARIQVWIGGVMEEDKKFVEAGR